MPKPLRTLIADKLEKSGVLPLQTAKIRGFMPIGRSDVASMYDESLPPQLSLSEAAQSLYISPRYLQRLLETSGTTLTAHVTELGLNHAFALLTAGQGVRICDVALQAGFSDISHNRLFRSRFGRTAAICDISD